MNIKVVLDKGASVPSKTRESDVGYDIKANNVKFIGLQPVIGLRGDNRAIYAYVEVDTGVHVKPEDGYYVEVIPNSRWGKRGVVPYSNGIIDPEYTGSIKLIFKLLSWYEKDDIPKVGDVVGQLIIRNKYDTTFEVVDSLPKTDRGDGAFGSTEKS